MGREERGEMLSCRELIFGAAQSSRSAFIAALGTFPTAPGWLELCRAEDALPAQQQENVCSQSH